MYKEQKRANKQNEEEKYCVFCLKSDGILKYVEYDTDVWDWYHDACLEKKIQEEIRCALRIATIPYEVIIKNGGKLL